MDGYNLDLVCSASFCQVFKSVGSLRVATGCGCVLNLQDCRQCRRTFCMRIYSFPPPISCGGVPFFYVAVRFVLSVSGLCLLPVSSLDLLLVPGLYVRVFCFAVS